MNEIPENSRQITLLLHKWQEGDKDAFDKVMQYVYDDLKRRASAYMKNERPEHSLQTTGLVHEAFIKLVDKEEIEYDDRNHFFAIASKVMRRILVDYARRRNRDKRGGSDETLPLDEAIYLTSRNSQVDLVALDEALNKLALFDEREAKIVELKFFGDMTLEEIAEILSVSKVTVKRDWSIAKTWLRQELK